MSYTLDAHIIDHEILGVMAAGSAGATHNLLSAEHPDTVPASPVLGDLIFGNSSPAWERLPGNITTRRKFLRQLGDGAISAAPEWDELVAGDIPDLSATYQPLDLDLSAISALSGTGIAVRTASNTWALRSIAQGTGITVTNGDGVAGNPTVALTIPVVATSGGTGFTSYAVGDLLYADTTTTLAKLADVATGNAVISGGISTAPSWGKIGLTTHVSGILPLANGGTGANLSATGGAANYVKQSSVGAVFTVGTIPASDIASGAALTKTDDTNVTLTLGGSPTTALLAATSLTLGWTGQLSLAKGGTAANLTASNGGVVYSTASALAILAGTATAGQVLRSGATAAPSWSTATYPATAGTSGNVLRSDGTNWVSTSLASAGIVGGSGTQNYIPKWNNAAGTTLGSSLLRDNFDLGDASVTIAGSLLPDADTAWSLGSATLQWTNVNTAEFRSNASLQIFSGDATSVPTSRLLFTQTDGSGVAYAEFRNLDYINIGQRGSGVATEVRFLEPPGGTNYSAFKAQTQAGNITYTLPAADAVGVLTSDGAGGLSWGSISAAISDTAYDATTWNGVTTIAPSKNAVRDKFETKTGSGNLVYDNTPTLITPVLGVATATTINKVTLTAPATGSTLTIADGKTFTANQTLTLTGVSGKTLTINKSLTLDGTDSTTMTFPTTNATIARTDAAQTFTGVQTFSSQDVHTSGLDLSTSGVIVSNVVTGASAIGFDLQDNISRSNGGELSFRLRNTNLSKSLMVSSWDGRFAFGYEASLAPITGTILGFTATDSNSPTGAPTFIGIFSQVSHANTAETATTGPFALVGVAGVSTLTGLTGKMQAGVVGSVVSSLTTATGQIFAGFVSAMENAGTSHAQPATKDVAFGKNAHFKASADHITGYWAQVLNASSSTGYGTTYPPLVSSARLCIQDYGAPITDIASTTEYWSVYGENINGTVATFPNITGFLRMTYPRRTGRTGVRAMQAWWEPWPNTSTIRGGSAVGDTYFDDGTNFAPGLHESVTAGVYKRLLITDGNGRATAQTAANTNILTQAVGNVDGTFLVGANVLVTTSTTHSFSVTVDYTDEGNTARTLTLNFTTLAGAFETLITNVSGAVPHEGSPSIIRCKSGTNIVFKTAGTFTTVTYNVDCSAVRLQ